MKVKIYSTKFCPHCIEAKAYLKEKGVDFEEIKVDEDQDAAQEMIKKSKQMSVPVIEINDKIIIGFDKEEIDKALEEK
jgi:glutaredoxin 3